MKDAFNFDNNDDNRKLIATVMPSHVYVFVRPGTSFTWHLQ